MGILDTDRNSIASSNAELERKTGNTGAYATPQWKGPPPADPPVSAMGGKYFGPRSSDNIADNPLVVNEPNGGRRSNVFGWLKAGVKNAFGVGGDDTAAPAANTIAGTQTAAPAGSARVAMPAKIRGFDVNQNADGSGTLTGLGTKAPRNRQAKVGGDPTGVGAIPNPAGTEIATTAPPLQSTPAPASAQGPVGSAGYGEYTGEPDSRIYAGPPVAPIAGLAPPQAPQVASTVGYGNGIENYDANGNLLNSSRKLDKNSELADIAMARINSKLAGQDAVNRNLDANVTHLQNTDALNAAKAPMEMAAHKADIGYKKMLTDKGIAMTPGEVAKLAKEAEHLGATTDELKLLMEPKRLQLIEDVNYKKRMADIADKKLGILSKQIEARMKLMGKGNNTDYAGISKYALDAMKMLDAKTALAGGALPPEEAQLYKNYRDVFNKAYLMQQKAGPKETADIALGGDDNA